MRYIIMRSFASLLMLVAFAAFAADDDSAKMASWEGLSAPPAGKALVVFMRPSAYGALISASVYYITGDQETFIGVVKHDYRVAHVADPGERMFMVLGENVDFLDAKLDADKTYYVLVSPRIGAWKARFSLRPVRNDAISEYNTQSADFAKWQQETKWMQRTAAGDAWYAGKKSEIATKKAKYMERWNARPSGDKLDQFLRPEDGV